jgi:hypothetical protein
MKRILALLVPFLLVAGLANAQQSVFVPATQASVVVGTVATITQIIPAVTGKSIYITNISLHPAATSVVTISYGTGTNCGTGTVAFYGPGTFQAGENVYDGTGYRYCDCSWFHQLRSILGDLQWLAYA